MCVFCRFCSHYLPISLSTLGWCAWLQSAGGCTPCWGHQVSPFRFWTHCLVVCLSGLVSQFAVRLLALSESVPDSVPGGWAKPFRRPMMLENLRRTEGYCRVAVLFGTPVFMNGLFGEVSVEKAWIFFLCFSSFFILCRCVEKSSYCGNVLDDNVPTWRGGGW